MPQRQGQGIPPGFCTQQLRTAVKAEGTGSWVLLSRAGSGVSTLSQGLFSLPHPLQLWEGKDEDSDK